MKRNNSALVLIIALDIGITLNAIKVNEYMHIRTYKMKYS